MLTALALAAALAAPAAAAPPRPFTQVAGVEGVNEYRLPNGLRVLFVPDESVATFTLNLTVLVGSRHEGYGEKGMAHLLEHMLFKGSTHYKDPKEVMGKRGARWNGTTREDRTNYYETLPASDANLEFAIRFEADRLVNSFVEKKDLDTEMTVVRNEFEASENNGPRVLTQRVRSAALPWHNYGRAVIGIKADIERVPIDNLKAFYKRYYQPDNAVIVLAGRFEEAKAFRWIADSFGRIPRPARKLGDTFTEEPVQDGERTVTVRRVGGTPLLAAAWRISAETDPDYPALAVLQGVVGDQPQGYLHQAIVDGKKGAFARCDLDDLREPGLFTCLVMLKPGDDVAAARETLLKTLETPRTPTQAEVDRARDGWLSQIEQTLENSEQIGLWLSEWAAVGDWRMLYVQRDRLKQVDLASVQRVWARYFKPQNRTLGEYVPTGAPDRAEIPLAPDVRPLVEGYKGGEAVARGEAFDSSPQNIEKRTRRLQLANGMKVALLPKKTRAQTVKLAAILRIGSERSLDGQQGAGELTAALLNRGTRTLDYKAFRSALERLRAQLTVGGRGQTVDVSLEVQRPQLAEALALLGDVLHQPAFDPGEFEAARNEALASLEQQKDEPMALGMVELARAVTPLPPGHPRYVQTLPERAQGLRAVTLDQVKAFHQRLYGAQAGAVAVVGDFDAAEMERALASIFGGWTAPEPYQLAPDPYAAAKPGSVELKTPDKANAWMGAGTTLQLTDASPDYPAAQLAAFLLGGSASARLFSELREKQGLTYGAYAFLDAGPETDRASLRSSVIYAPQNAGPVEKGLRAELARWSSISADDLEKARSELLNERKQARANDHELATLLARQARLGRTMEWEAKLDAAYAALRPADVEAEVRKMIDPEKVVLVRAGDFKTIAQPK